MDSKPPINRDRQNAPDFNAKQRDNSAKRLQRQGSASRETNTPSDNARKSSLTRQSSNATGSIKSSSQTDYLANSYLENLQQENEKLKKLKENSNVGQLNIEQEDFSEFSYNGDNFPQGAQEEKKDTYVKQHIYEKTHVVFENEKILTTRWDPTDTYCAIGLEDGTIKIVQERAQSAVLSYSLIDKQEAASPVTSVRWINNQTVKNCLLATYSNGHILYWHATSGQLLHRYKESGNAINGCDVNFDSTKFATGGMDCQVRVYTCGRKAEPQVLNGGIVSCHSNRIFTVKFSQENPNILLSAGWDKTILIWDLRTGNSTNFIHGPQIYGDSLDIKDNLILAGSWRAQNQLQLFDIRSTKKVYSMIWDEVRESRQSETNEERGYIYSAQFGKSDPNYILAGSTGSYEMRLFDKNEQYRCIDVMAEPIKKGVFSLDWCNTKLNAAYGCSDGRWGNVEIL